MTLSRLKQQQARLNEDQQYYKEDAFSELQTFYRNKIESITKKIADAEK